MLKKQSMRVDTFEKICEALDITPMDLFQTEGEDGENGSNPTSVIIKAKEADYNDALMQKLDIIIDLLRYRG